MVGVLQLSRMGRRRAAESKRGGAWALHCSSEVRGTLHREGREKKGGGRGGGGSASKGGRFTTPQKVSGGLCLGGPGNLSVAYLIIQNGKLPVGARGATTWVSYKTP